MGVIICAIILHNTSKQRHHSTRAHPNRGIGQRHGGSQPKMNGEPRDEWKGLKTEGKKCDLIVETVLKPDLVFVQILSHSS